MTKTQNFDEVTRSTACTKNGPSLVVAAAVAAAVVEIYYRKYFTSVHLVLNERPFFYFFIFIIRLVYLILVSFNAPNRSDVFRVECDAEISTGTRTMGIWRTCFSNLVRLLVCACWFFCKRTRKILSFLSREWHSLRWYTIIIIIIWCHLLRR